MQKIYAAILAISFALASSAFAQNTGVIELGYGSDYGCYLNAPKNLLISLKRNRLGSVVDFDKALDSLHHTSRYARGSGREIHARSGKSPSSGTSALARAIKACRDGTLSPGGSVNCARSRSGCGCDDLNPCTVHDECRGSKCVGRPVGVTEKIRCGFGACSTLLSQCADGKLTVCHCGVAGNEICNGVDDDCNGGVDDGVACPGTVVTPTPTKTITPKPSRTPTQTKTPIATETPTAPPTPTTTVGPTLTPINTPTPSNTHTATPTNTEVPPTMTPVNTPTNTPTNTPVPPTPTPSNTPTNTPVPPTATPTNTPTNTPTPVPACFPADNAGRNSEPGCACIGTFDCCGICNANNLCTGSPRGGAGADPGAAPSCFPTLSCNPADNSGSDSENGCPCIGTFDCCGICSATGFCTGSKRMPSGADPGGAASCS